ncbi:MAG TPA: trehalose-phosphatase [Myxococcales bacterium]|nr:trehalose-phosphatase [Myxococcales bacterium]
MQPILSGNALQSLAGMDTLLGFDFDGTLAPLADDPSSPAMRAETRHLLAQVAQLYPCVVISGRPEEDVLRLLAGVTVWYVIGNRGLHPPPVLERAWLDVGRWEAALAERLAGIEGVLIENKGVSLAVHYRKAPDRERAREAIARARDLLGRVRMVEGKEVVNFLPEDGPDKGRSLARVRAHLGSAATLYVGDDETDEDAFRLEGVTGVRVGNQPGSAARYFLADQEEVDDLLEQLARARPRSERRPEAAPRARERSH